MSIRLSHITLPGYRTIEESPLPILRDPNEHGSVEFSDNVPPTLGEGFGHYTGYRVLPYKAQSHYHRAETPVELKTIIYENDVMRATFLPEFGGRLYSLYNKALDRELLSCNPVFQPANLALRNAWFSGGIEWNLSHYGHTYLTCESLFFGECTNEDGESFLRMYEYERVKKLFYQIDFHLPKGADHLVVYTKIINPYANPTPLYYWSNTAVSELNNARVFSSTDNVIYVKPYLNEQGEMVNTMAYGQLPHLEGIEGDVSYPRNFERSNEYFFQTEPNEPYPWEAVAYNDGTAFYECSTMPLRYRKMFCWGTHRGGTKWQDYLSHGNEDKYVEIQSGIYPTQLHSETISSETTVEFMQLFGLSTGLNPDAYYAEHTASRKYIQDHLFNKHDLDALSSLKQRMAIMADMPVDQLLHYGHGWGALELMRLEKEGQPLTIASMSFPQDRLEEEQDYWISLLNHEVTSSDDLNHAVPSFLTDTCWMPYINTALSKSDDSSERHILNKALILSETFDYEAAIQLMESSKSSTSTAMYLRTLGALLNQFGQKTEAYSYYEEAYFKLDEVSMPYFEVDFITEYMALLSDINQTDLLWDIYQHRLLNNKEVTEEMMGYIGHVAYLKEEWDTLERLFASTPERLREGKNMLCELWFKKKAHDLGHTSLKEVRKTYTPPANIDFRMS